MVRNILSLLKSYFKSQCILLKIGMEGYLFFYWLHTYLAARPVLSPILFTIFHMACAICIIPCSPMPVIAGLLWGKWLGLGISIFAAFVSACTTFWLARIFFRKTIYAFLAKRFKKTDWFLEQTEN